MFVTLDALTFTNGVLITVRDFVGKDAITGEVEGRRGRSSLVAASQFPTQVTAACEEDASVAETGKLRGDCLAGASMSPQREEFGGKLSLLSPDSQPL
ncbi:TPA: hypothetical protein ACH3X2_013541 [Trebouxia sp. C0005]